MEVAVRAGKASAANRPISLHRIVVVGGGAGGLELATRLGDKLGRRGKADITLIDKARAHLWKPLLHEIAAGSMDLGHHELDYLAQAHWHHFHYRIGEMAGLNRTRREVRVGPLCRRNSRHVSNVCDSEPETDASMSLPLALLWLCGEIFCQGRDLSVTE